MGYYVSKYCNGCGRYETRESGKFNVIGVDFTNYVLISSGFLMKDPKVELHFCNECFNKLKGCELKTLSSDYLNVIAERNKSLEKELSDIKSKFRDYKNNISSLLAAGEGRK